MHDRKFCINADGKVANRVTGEVIPDDEPIILFRARDWHAIAVLERYRFLVSDEHHQRAVDLALQDFRTFKEKHPDRMKEPGITKDFRFPEDG